MFSFGLHLSGQEVDHLSGWRDLRLTNKLCCLLSPSNCHRQFRQKVDSIKLITVQSALRHMLRIMRVGPEMKGNRDDEEERGLG